VKTALSILKKTWKGWCYFCGTFVLSLLIFAVFYETFKSEEREKDFVKTNLLPLANYVEIFQKVHGQLPTEKEFNSWAETNFENKAIEYYPCKPDFMWDWGNPEKDFVVGIWNGDEMLYYRSWSKKTFTRFQF